jgi:fructose-1,6-bisphosphatase I
VVNSINRSLPTASEQLGLTLTQHIMRRQSRHEDARGQLSALLTQIGVAAKLIAAQVRRAGLIELWGATGDINIQGETVQKLDRLAQDTLVEVLIRSGCVAAMASEEEDEIIEVPKEYMGDYIVCFDPLDGSSNIDANVSIGTIFAIYRRTSEEEVLRKDVLRPGREQIAAGYVIYGSSTVLVYTVGESVDCFTLDPSAGEFFLTRDNLRLSEKTKILSINECNEPYWPKWVRNFIDEVKRRNDSEKRRVISRHIGSLVADFHRNLVYGGLFLYPADSRSEKGKLRVIYECNPLGFIAEVAGGAAYSGTDRVLDLEPTGLHDRCGLIIGPKKDVELAVQFVRDSRV